jgi:putative heme iron utilization protein
MFKINLSRYKIAKMNALKVRTESKFKNVHLICLKIDFNKLITAWLIQSKEKFGE